jgi:hypothetical protein
MTCRLILFLASFISFMNSGNSANKMMKRRGVWTSGRKSGDEVYGLLSLLAREFVGAEIPEEVVSAWVCPRALKAGFGPGYATVAQKKSPSRR